MRRSIIVLGIALGAASLSACSDKTRNETEEAGNAIASDIDNAGDNAANAAERATDSANAAIDRASNRIDAAANKAEQKAQDAKRATGRALENAGEALQKYGPAEVAQRPGENQSSLIRSTISMKSRAASRSASSLKAMSRSGALPSM
jgi:hypothetical protein